MLTDDQLRQIMPRLLAAKRALYLPHLNRAMAGCGIDSPARTAAFVAQLAHESGEFRWMEEIWGPSPAQLRYEPPNDLARRLGNTQPGDGKRFKGRGPIQITGRANYATYGKLLGIDLVAEPARAAAPEIAFATAGRFWQHNGLNELADTGQFIAITRRINGGTNGLADRQMYYERAQAVLLSGAVARAASRGAPFAPLPRGHEAIVGEAGGGVVPAAAKRPPAAKRAAKKAPAAKAIALKSPASKAPAVRRPAAKKAAPTPAAPARRAAPARKS